MKGFVYDPERSFRAWLKTVTHHTWRDLAASRRHMPVGGSTIDEWDQLLSLAARDDLNRRLEQQFDHELLDEAMVRVRLRVAPHNWEAFKLAALDREPPQEVARRLSMKVAHVYSARSSVQRLLREEIQKLEGGET
jgi:RNA polymerase sigma-70 factor (ECF subfamily)